MSVPRILFAPTHRTGLAGLLAAGFAELSGEEGRQVRFHHVGALCPGAAWDRWEGSSFLDPALYDDETLLTLYEQTVRGADISILATDRGVLDETDPTRWSPADVARALECPVLLVADSRGWGQGLAAVVRGFVERLDGVDLAGLVLTGVRDEAHREQLRHALSGGPAPVVGCAFERGLPGWDAKAPGPWGLPLDAGLVEAVGRQVDVTAVEALAVRRGFLPVAVTASERTGTGPLVVVAGGPGFTPWSRDSIEVLRLAGARVRRLDLAADRQLPPETAGLVIAGHLWPHTLGELAENFALMRDLRVRVAEGLPTLAMGGGMLYLLRRVQDMLGRTHELAGVLPGEGEMLGDLDEPIYLEVRAERDTVLLSAGEVVTGWVTVDAEIMEAPVSRSFPLSLAGEGWPSRQMEGAATNGLLCSRVLMHLASQPRATRAFLTACARYEQAV